MEEKFLAIICSVKRLILEKEFKECEVLLSSLMFQNPHDAIPHNLMGLVLEYQGNHVQAMKHFRAAYALDPTYIPTSWNLEYYGSYCEHSHCAFSVLECNANDQNRMR